MATAVAAVVARVAPRAADRAAAARAVLALRRQGCSGSSGSSDGDGTSLSTASSTALTRVLARAFGGVDSGGVRAISENSTGPHTVDVGAPPDWAAPGLMRRRVRVGGCSEAWRELGVRLDTKPAPWLEDNGPWLVSGCRWSEGVFAHCLRTIRCAPHVDRCRSKVLTTATPLPTACTLRSFGVRVPCAALGGRGPEAP